MVNFEPAVMIAVRINLPFVSSHFLNKDPFLYESPIIFSLLRKWTCAIT